MSEAARIANLCGKPKPGSGGYNCLCPAHEDREPSCHVSDRRGGGILITCRAGCDQGSIVEALRRRGWWKSQVARRERNGEWFYHNADGVVTLRIERWDKPGGDKDYFPIQPDGNGGWLPAGTRGWEPVLYNLPNVIARARKGGTIFLVEGEKCAEAINERSAGKLCATTMQGGASARWKNSYTESLRGAKVVLIYDNDEAGKKWADKTALKLAEAGIKCRVMGMPGVGTKGDVYDWFYLGGTIDDLKRLVTECPIWTPPAMSEQQAAILKFPEQTGADVLQVPKAMIDTDVANSLRFVRDHGELLHWTPQTRWLIWDGTRYVLDLTNQVRELAIKTAGTIFQECAVAKIEDRKHLFKWAKTSQSRAGLSNMVHLAEHKLAASFNEFDADPWLLNTANGVVDLRARAATRFREHDKALKISKITGINYDPAATCPTWIKFLEVTQWGDAEMIGFLQRAVGSTLTGITRDQKVFFVYGPGGNGKSIFLNTVLALLGEYGASVRAKMFMQKATESQTDNIGLTFGKRFVALSEIGANDRLDEALIKDFSGGDPVRGRALYQESFEFAPVGKLFFRGNHKPYVEPNDDGIWRRLLLIPFTVAITEEQRDKTLQAKLMAELPGILNWAIEGCLDWQQCGGLVPPQSVIAETEAYRKEVDVIGEFIEMRCVMHPEYSCRSEDLFKAFREFCSDGNHFFGNINKFSRELTKRGFTTYRSNGKRYKGLQLV